MINSERLEDLRINREASNLSIAAEQERVKLRIPFKEFMDSAFWNVKEYTGDQDAPCQFSRHDMFIAFMYGYREGRTP